MYLKMTMNFWSPCLYIQTAGVTGVQHHAWLTQCWGMGPRVLCKLCKHSSCWAIPSNPSSFSSPQVPFIIESLTVLLQSLGKKGTPWTLVKAEQRAAQVSVFTYPHLHLKSHEPAASKTLLGCQSKLRTVERIGFLMCLLTHLRKEKN